MAQQRRPGGRGAGLTAEQIVAAALEVMDRDGAEDLKMATVAEALGVKPQALYWHFAGKDALCQAVVDAVSADLPVRRGRGSPRRRLEEHLHDLRDHWNRHPSALALGRRFTPSVTGDFTGHGIELLASFGVPASRRTDRYQSLVWTVMGFVLAEERVTTSIHHERVPDRSGHYVVRMPDREWELDTNALFASTVRLLLDGLQREVEGGPATQGRRRPAAP